MVPGELSQWLEERQVDLQHAFAREDDVGVLELTSKMAKGAERLIQLTRQPGTTDELVLRGAPGEGAVFPRIECSLGCHEALVPECERQVRVAGGSGWERQPIRVQPTGRRDCGHCQWSWHSDTESDDEGRHVVRSLEAQSVDTDDQQLLLAHSSPPSEVIRALEEDLCSHPRASRRVVLVPQSPHRQEDAQKVEFGFGERTSLTRFQFRTKQMHLIVTTRDCFECEGRCKWSARMRAGARSLRCLATPTVKIRRGWEAMDTVNLQELRGRVQCVQGVPSFFERPVQVSFGCQFGGHEGGLQHW